MSRQPIIIKPGWIVAGAALIGLVLWGGYEFGVHRDRKEQRLRKEEREKRVLYFNELRSLPIADRGLFGLYDFDGNGKLSPYEFGQAMKSRDSDRPDRRLQSGKR